MKKTRFTNHRVEVIPEEPYLWRDDEAAQHRKLLEICGSIQLDIRRHCDNVRVTSIRYDTEHTCSHCGYPWEDNPECCDAAIKEWDPTFGTEV